MGSNKYTGKPGMRSPGQRDESEKSGLKWWIGRVVVPAFVIYATLRTPEIRAFLHFPSGDSAPHSVEPSSRVDIQAEIDKALAKLQRKDWPGTIAALDGLPVPARNTSDVHYIYGKARWGLNQDAASIAELDRAVKLNSKNIEALRQLRDELMQIKGDSKKALVVARQTADQTGAWNDYDQLGNAYMLDGNVHDAGAAYEQAGSLPACPAEVLARAGACLENAGDPQQARFCYEQACQRAPSVFDYQLHVAYVEIQMGDRPRALAHFKQAYKISRDPVQKKKISAILGRVSAKSPLNVGAVRAQTVPVIRTHAAALGQQAAVARAKQAEAEHRRMVAAQSRTEADAIRRRAEEQQRTREVKQRAEQHRRDEQRRKAEAEAQKRRTNEQQKQREAKQRADQQRREDDQRRKAEADTRRRQEDEQRRQREANQRADRQRRDDEQRRKTEADTQRRRAEEQQRQAAADAQRKKAANATTPKSGDRGHAKGH